jgi:hypothetical protein
MSDYYTARTATLWIPAAELLDAIWYSDGSGWHGMGAGIADTPDAWRVTAVALVADLVEIKIERNP